MEGHFDQNDAPSTRWWTIEDCAEEEAARLVDAFDGRIAYLRMTTPRRPASQKGRTSIVYRNGEKVDAARERDKAKWSNWDGSNMDPDSVARHNRSLRRAGFRDNAHAKGFF